MWLRNTLLMVVIIIYSTNAETGKQCTTPNGEQAICISIYKCKKLLDVVLTKDKNQIRFLQNSQCDENAFVCCGTLDNYRESNIIKKIPDPIEQPTNPNIPSRKSCGFQENNRIYRGEDTDMGEFPWMALIQYKNSSGHESFGCGGTLISPRYILTAAHCVKIKNTSKKGPPFLVRLGEWNTDTDIDCINVAGKQRCNDPAVDIEIESTKVHEDYNTDSSNKANDIALIRLKTPINYTDYIRPICLPLRTEISNIGDYLTVSGWGRTEKSINSTIKQKLNVPLVTKSKCAQLYTRSAIHLTDKQICAGGEAGRDSCKGDSGGPLMRTSPSDVTQWYIEGIVSIGPLCGTLPWPGVYTQVTSYLDWIYANVKA